MLPARGRTVEAGDILILVKSRNSFFDAMIRALWNEHVPVAGADRLKLGREHRRPRPDGARPVRPDAGGRPCAGLPAEEPAPAPAPERG